MTGLGPGEWYVDKATIYVPFCVFAYLRLSTQRLFSSKGRFFCSPFSSVFSVFWAVKPSKMRPKMAERYVSKGGQTVRT